MILAATPSQSGAPDPDLVTPGTIGFLLTFVIVIAAIFLIRDALKRVRRVRARAYASDAYPIPMRKYAVPNQSKLSGAEAPKADGDDSESDDTELDDSELDDTELSDSVESEDKSSQ